jgi:hypothetical protein
MVIYTQALQKRKKTQASFAILELVIEAQCLREPCQLHLQNWQNWTFHHMER